MPITAPTNPNQIGQGQYQLDPVALNIKRGMGANVFVKFIPLGVSEEEFRTQFEKAGSIKSLKMSQNPARQFQHAYVMYTDVGEA